MFCALECQTLQLDCYRKLSVGKVYVKNNHSDSPAMFASALFNNMYENQNLILFCEQETRILVNLVQGSDWLL
jgi:hypothetical protein